MTTALTSTFVLPEDVLVIPVEELAPATRARLECAAGDFAITRPQSRRASSVVDSNSARLIELFREPRRVVDAIVQFSRDTGADPRVVLESAFPVVEQLVSGGVLLPVGDERARPIEDTLKAGDRVGDFTIIDRVQTLEDVEIHRARSSDGRFAAIKIARPGYSDRIRASLAREAAILYRLDGCAAPSVLANGLDASLPYLALSWCAGVHPAHAAENNSDRAATLAICRGIARAFADLHDRGVLHGDVHDGNVLVGADGSVVVLDFGLAAVPADPTIGFAPRGGMLECGDPQLAAAQRRDTQRPPLDETAEQYSVAALLYLVATGHHYLEFSLRRDEALRQIVEDQPLPFDARGRAPWPGLESILARALSKEPENRYASTRALADALDHLEPPVAAPAVSRLPDRRRFIDALVARLTPQGPLYESRLTEPPLCSVNNGAAGIAYAFYRMSLARESAELLAWADAWTARGKSWTASDEAWYTNDGVISKRDIGTNALYHTVTGLQCVEALVALAAGEQPRAERCANEFAAASRKRSASIDLTLGSAGLVVGATLMLEASPAPWPALRERAGAVAARLAKSIDGFGPVASEPRLTFLGIAHGWSGLLWTLMRWHRSNGTTMPTCVEPRLQELADLATPRGRGLAWAWSADARDIGSEPHPAPSWCNGTSGHLHTWLEAHAAFGDDAYLDLARGAAWNIWDDSRDEIADACCGLVGRAYALLAFGRRTGDSVWRHRAEQLADRALALSLPEAATSHRLYKGALGVALLLDEIENDPEGARMPLFESEGWHRGWT
jgi:eukaryotic-like serine/threonine-protein kinase